MSAKRLGSGATSNALQNRCLHFQKTALFEETAGFPHNHDPFLENDARTLIREKIEVTLAVACLDVL